jgi:MobA/MobL family
MIADINIHHLDRNNPHAHILLTMRNLQTSSKGEVEFGLKNTDWNSRDLLLAQRKSWEQITNKYLAAAGSEAKIDCRSLEEQGSPFIPQIHLGVHATAMKRKGIATDRSDEFDRIQLVNNDIRTRLEEIYQQEYTEPEQDREKYREPELEVKPELTEQQQQQIAADRKLAELIIEVMPKSKETQTFGVYTIKPHNDGFDVRTNNNHNVILKLKLEDDIWIKYIRYSIKGEQRKHHYSNSDIDAKVEDFTKVIAEHKRKSDDLKIEAAFEKERIRAEKERIKTEIEIQKVNREKAKAEAQIQKINNERLKPQKAEERRVRMEAQQIETKQRNLKKAEALAASQIIANAERQIRLTAQRIEARQREIERDKIKKEEAKLVSEKRKAERQRVSNEINKAAENICHLIQNAIYVKFDVEGSTLGIIRHSESCIEIDTIENWYTLYLGNDNNWTIRENYYNTQSIDNIYKTIEKCLQIGILIFKKEEESEEVIVDVVTPLIAEQIKIISNELQNPEKVTSDIERQISNLTSPPKVESGDVVSRINLVLQKLTNQDEQKLEEPETIESKPAIEEPETIELKPTPEDLKSVIAGSDLIIEEEQPIEVVKINQPTIKKAAKTKTRRPDRGR